MVDNQDSIPQSEVPEIDVASLMRERRSGNQVTILDCREPYEWRQVRIPGSVHIPMNEIPARLPELDKQADIIVICAHGYRSYNVAEYLIQHGFSARSLHGGIFDWYKQHGEVESG